MKKKLFFLLCLILLALSASALAGGPAGGLVPRSLPLTSPGSIADLFQLAGGAGSASVSGPRSCVTGREYTWTLRDATSTSATNQYEFFMTVMDGTYESPWTADIQYAPGRSGSRTLRYTFYLPGTYYIFVDGFASAGSGKVLFTQTYAIDVSDGGENELTRKVSSVAEENRVPGNEFQTVLNLHDWVLDHCEYDYDYVYYSADSLLLHGTGVCNSYTRALALLLKEAGIECRRVAGYVYGDPENSRHAWNAVKIDGQWYLLDATWDDLTGDFRRHAYFAVNDSLMGIEHTPTHYTGGKPVCSGLAANYFVRDGRWEAYAPLLRQHYSEMLEAGWHRFKLLAPAYCSDEYGRTLLGTVSAWALDHESLTGPDGKAYSGSFSYLYDAARGKGYIVGKHTSAGTLVLPLGLTRVEKDSFSSSAANYVEIPENCTYIGPGAFSGMEIWELTVGAENIYIDPDAFGEADSMYVIAPEGSSARDYAESRGWAVGDGLDYVEGPAWGE